MTARQLREEYDSLDPNGKIKRYYLDWLGYNEDSHIREKEDLAIITLHNNILQMESQIEFIKSLIRNGEDGSQTDLIFENTIKTIQYAIDALSGEWQRGDSVNLFGK